MSGDTTVKNVKVVVAGDASGAQNALNETEATAGAVASKIKSHFAGVFSTLSNNPALSGFTSMFSELSSSFDGLNDKAETLSDRVSKVGLATAGVGGALTMMSQGDAQAESQLAQAFQNVGANLDDYKGKVDTTVGAMAKFGYTSEQTYGALQTLVQATGSPTKAFNDMGVAANLAAARHESLGAAATQVAQILAGKGTKALSDFGITVTKTKGSTTDYQQVLDQLAKKVNGQASAASDTFTGKLKALRAEVENHVTEFGQKYGPTITAAGAAMSVLGATANGVSSIMSALRGTTEAAGAAQETLTGAQTAGEAAADGLAAGEGAADAAGLPLIATIGLIVAAVALVAVGIYELVTHWQTVFATMKAVVNDCWKFIDSNFVEPIKSFFTTITGFIQSHWQLILGIITGPIGLAVVFITEHFNSIVSFFEGLPAKVGQVFSTVGSAVENAFSTAISKVIGFFQKLPANIVNALSGLAGQMEQVGSNIVSAIAKGITNAPHDIMNAIKGLVPGGGVVGKALHAIGLAEGGIVTKPTLAVVGEAGYPEAVIPLKNGVSAKGFNDSVQQLQNGMFAVQPGSGSSSGANYNVQQIINLPTGTPQQFAQETTWALGRLAS